jgi:DNA-binding winged helix-turn-helix (wHTH) protein
MLFMDQNPWTNSYTKTILNIIKLKLPCELVFFPSSGLSSTLDKLKSYLDKNKYLVLVFDIRYVDNIKSNEFNKYLLTLLDQQKINIDIGKNNFFESMDQLIHESIASDKEMIFIFKTSSHFAKEYSLEIIKVINYFNRKRINNNSKVHFIISSDTKIFDQIIQAPCSMYTKYFSYYDYDLIYRAIEEYVFKDLYEKPYDHNLIPKLIEISGGFVALAKSIVRDLIILEKPLEYIYNIEYNYDFFESFINLKVKLALIFKQLSQATINTLFYLATNQAVPDKYLHEHNELKNFGLLDDEGKIRGKILTNYILNYIQPIESVEPINTEVIKSVQTAPIVAVTPKQIEPITPTPIPLIAQSTSQQTQNKDFMIINPSLKIDNISGEIYIDNVKQPAYLSVTELNIITKLYKNRGRYISREEVSKIIWQHNNLNKYSNWAMDKTFSRIRNKLNDEKPYRIIQTMRDRGYIMPV